ncbi:MAG: DUF523 domain-containing protein [Archangium sp.]|nr:DUF523 domain-containing protein [Archangium sp.]MDP3571428.1 DUF523 domain-containing protein [Archangium sp.]
MKKVLISACLLGERVRFDGREKGSQDEVLARWLAEGRVVKVCPEVEGGLSVPRPPAEQQPDGRVLTDTGLDVTAAFTRGAAEALRLAREHHIEVAVLKEGSPSCGSGFIYDGSFSKVKLPGKVGETTRVLQENGVRVFSELQWAEADAIISAGD